MKMKKIIAMVIIISLISCFMVSCIHPSNDEEEEEQHPLDFLGSIWESEDKLVRFDVDLNFLSYVSGTIKKGEETIDMFFKSTSGDFGMLGWSAEEHESLKMNEYKYNQIIKLKEYEDYKLVKQRGQEGYFVAEVIHSSIYKNGEQIKFYRVDETKDIIVTYFSLKLYEDEIKKYPSTKVIGSAKDIKSAVSQARSALEQEYGTLSDDLKIYYDTYDKCWLVKGSSKDGSNSPHIIFYADGKVLAMWD